MRPFTPTSWIALGLCALVGTTAPKAQVGVPGPMPLAGPQASGTLELLLDQGRRLFDGFQYDQAVPLFDRLILALAPGGQAQRPDLLAQALELRARSRFALGDAQGAEQDFSSLLALNPAYKLGAGISPRVVAVFESVRKLVVGQVLLSLVPGGDAQIDGQTVSLKPEPQPVDLAAGDHQITVTRQGYRPLEQRFTVAPGSSVPLALTLERVSATLTVASIPDGVEVLLNGTSKGTTARGETATGPSAPLVIGDLPTGSHRLVLRRACFQDVERTVTVARPEDLAIEPLRLTPSVANVRIQANEPGAAVFLDGAGRGNAPVEIAGLCAGSHVIEVRGSRGRFIDRREWRTGDNVTLSADLKPAYPVIVSTRLTPQLRADVERTLSAAKGVLVYVPADADVERALAGENVPANWFDPAGGSRVSRDLVRDLSRRLSTKLGAQGVAAVSVSADGSDVSVGILAAGSGEPDVVSFSLADPASRTRAVDRLNTPLPPLLRPSIQSSVVDLTGVTGAMVVRVTGSGAKAGLAVGDVIVGAGGTPVASVRDLTTKLATLPASNLDLPLEVKSAGGPSKTVNGAVVLVPDTMPLRDSALPYNRVLFDLQEVVGRSTSSALEKAAAHVNLAIAHMRLGNWSDAETELRGVQLPDGAGVSAGTVAYLLGLCLEAQNKTADARTAFTRAAAAAEARLSSDGPLVAPLAKQKLR